MQEQYRSLNPEYQSSYNGEIYKQRVMEANGGVEGEKLTIGFTITSGYLTHMMMHK